MVSKDLNKIRINKLYKVFGPRPKKVMSLVTQGISKSELLRDHNHILALRNVNLAIQQGKLQVIMGLSGSGKSTLIRHINRLIEPTSGDIWYDNNNILSYSSAKIRKFRRENISMVFQNFALMPHQNISQNVELGLKVQGKSKSFRVKVASDWIKKVGLQGFEKYYPHQLSGGMRQRVGLARALATNAEVLLMDEPFSALDPLIKTDMQTLLIKLQKEVKKTIIFVTHDLEEAIYIGDKIVILKDGEAIQNGNSQQILLQPKNDYIASFTRRVNRGRAIKVGSITNSTEHTHTDAECNENTCLEEALKMALKSPEKKIRVINDNNDYVGFVDAASIMETICEPK